MKRFAMLLTVMMLAITSAFSASQPTEVKAKVSLNLTDADVTGYKVGFTTQAKLDENKNWEKSVNDLTDFPAEVTDIQLGYDKSNGFVSDTSHFIFYKLRGSKGVTLKLSADKALTKADGTKIDYTVVVNGQNDANVVDTEGSGKSWTSATIDMDPTTGCKTGTLSLAIKSKAPVNATQVGEYSSTLTLTVSSVG